MEWVYPTASFRKGDKRAYRLEDQLRRKLIGRIKPPTTFCEGLVTDHVDAITRSKIMKAVPTKNTSLEMSVRKLLTQMGFRYRLHRKDLPGTPDIVFPRLRKAIFVNGCFWHQHADCPRGRPPKSRSEYWNPKLARNVANDTKNLRSLTNLQWQVLVIWGCQSKDLSELKDALMRFLSA